jgi:transposase
MSRFTAEQLGGIEAVTIDTWVPLSNPVRANLDGADDKIVCERFHIMGHLNKAVDSVRKQENRALATQGGKTLSGSKYLWLYGAVNLPSKHEGRFAALRRTDLKMGRAWTIKESMRHFWKYVQRG